MPRAGGRPLSAMTVMGVLAVTGRSVTAAVAGPVRDRCPPEVLDHEEPCPPLSASRATDPSLPDSANDDGPSPAPSSASGVGVGVGGGGVGPRTRNVTDVDPVVALIRPARLGRRSPTSPGSVPACAPTGTRRKRAIPAPRGSSTDKR